MMCGIYCTDLKEERRTRKNCEVLVSRHRFKWFADRVCKDTWRYIVTNDQQLARDVVLEVKRIPR